MGFETREIDLWMKETLNNWAEQGSLSSERSAQLQLNIINLSKQDRKNYITRKVCGLVAALITFIWLLFASCPVAAASYVGSPKNSTQSPQIKIVVLFSVLIFFFIKHQFQSKIKIVISR
jgi:hypothetical protein